MRCLEQWQNLLEYFFEVHSYHIYFQNICYEHRTLYTAEGTISMQELWSLPVIYVFCCTRYWNLSSKVSVWIAHDSHVVSLYGRDDLVQHEKFINKKYLALEDSSPKKAEDIISINSLRSEVSSTGFLFKLWRYCWQNSLAV